MTSTNKDRPTVVHYDGFHDAGGPDAVIALRSATDAAGLSGVCEMPPCPLPHAPGETPAYACFRLDLTTFGRMRVYAALVQPGEPLPPPDRAFSAVLDEHLPFIIPGDWQKAIPRLRAIGDALDKQERLIFDRNLPTWTLPINQLYPVLGRNSNRERVARMLLKG